MIGSANCTMSFHGVPRVISFVIFVFPPLQINSIYSITAENKSKFSVST